MASQKILKGSSELKSSRKNCDRFEFFQLKLTDSAWNSLKAVVNSPASGKTLKINVNQGNGSLELPTLASEEIPTSFLFKMTPYKHDTSVSFECIRKSQKKGVDTLQSMGKIPSKLQIHAKDDVYGATRLKLTQVEQEKELHKTQTIHRPTEKTGKLKKILKKQAVEELQHQTEMNDLITDNIPLSFRDRIIHALALAPYKVHELLCHLNQQCLPNRKGIMVPLPKVDRFTLEKILAEVAKINKKEMYNLLPEFYSHIREHEWPLYQPKDTHRVRESKKLVSTKDLRPIAFVLSKKDVTTSLKESKKTNNELKNSNPTVGSVDSHEYQQRIQALDLLADKKSISEVSKLTGASDDLVLSWLENESHIRKMAEERGIVGKFSSDDRIKMKQGILAAMGGGNGQEQQPVKKSNVVKAKSVKENKPRPMEPTSTSPVVAVFDLSDVNHPSMRSLLYGPESISVASNELKTKISSEIPGTGSDRAVLHSQYNEMYEEYKKVSDMLINKRNTLAKLEDQLKQCDVDSDTYKALTEETLNISKEMAQEPFMSLLSRGFFYQYKLEILKEQIGNCTSEV